MCIKVDVEKAPQKSVVFAASTDGTIREIEFGKVETKFMAGTSYNQILMMHGKKAFFAGTGVPGKPGSLQVVSYPFWDKVYEV